MLTYKGYSGTVKFDAEAEIFHGEVSGLLDVVTFQGRSARELKQAFRDSIDDYLELCQETGRPPDKPFSGRLIVRMRPEFHRALHHLAAAEQASLNQVIVDLLKSGLEAQASKDRSIPVPVSSRG